MTSSKPPSPEEPGPFDFAVYCPVDNALLPILRRLVTDVAEEMGFGGEDVLKIEMAVDEACSNIVLHAYDKGERGQEGIELKLSLASDVLTVQIQDQGRGGLPDAFKGADSIADYQKLGRDEYHGLGLLIMEKFMDEVHLQARPEAGTRVTMRKILRREKVENQ